MKKNKYIFVLLLLISISVVCTCGTFFYVKFNNGSNASAASGGEGDEFVIMTSCNPVYIATLNVVGDTDGVTVSNLSQPTTGCLHDYTLTTEDMKNLSSADVLVVNGGGMEGYLDDVVEAYPELTIIDTFEYVEDRVELPEEEDHEHEADEHSQKKSAAQEPNDFHRTVEDEHEGHHHEENSHIWMDSELFSYQVQAISEGLGEVDTAHADLSKKNAEDYVSVLNSYVDKSDLESLQGANVAVLHAAFVYTAGSLDANVVAVMELDEERQVSAGEVSDFIETIKEKDVKLVFAEYDYGNAMGKLIMEQTDAKVVYLETLVHGSYGVDDYLTTMNENYARIANVVE